MSNPLDSAKEVLAPHLSSVDPSKALVAAKIWGLMHGYHARMALNRFIETEKG